MDQFQSKQGRIFGIGNGTVHEHGTHLTEFHALKRLSKDVSPHLFSWTVTKANVTRIIVMFDKEIFGLDVFGTFGAGNVTVLFK